MKNTKLNVKPIKMISQYQGIQTHACDIDQVEDYKADVYLCLYLDSGGESVVLVTGLCQLLLQVLVARPLDPHLVLVVLFQVCNVTLQLLVVDNKRNMNICTQKITLIALNIDQK